jgi:hypothetical protein
MLCMPCMLWVVCATSSLPLQPLSSSMASHLLAGTLLTFCSCLPTTCYCCPACLPTPAHPAEVYGFSSERKMASVLVRRNGKLRLYNKGAAEMVLTCCTAMVNSDGQSVPMTEVGGWQWVGVCGQQIWPLTCAVLVVLCCAVLLCFLSRKWAAPLQGCWLSPQCAARVGRLQTLREELMGTVTGMASTGLRTLCLAYTGARAGGQAAARAGGRAAAPAAVAQRFTRSRRKQCKLAGDMVRRAWPAQLLTLPCRLL